MLNQFKIESRSNAITVDVSDTMIALTTLLSENGRAPSSNTVRILTLLCLIMHNQRAIRMSVLQAQRNRPLTQFPTEYLCCAIDLGLIVFPLPLSNYFLSRLC